MWFYVVSYTQTSQRNAFNYIILKIQAAAFFSIFVTLYQTAEHNMPEEHSPIHSKYEERNFFPNVGTHVSCIITMINNSNYPKLKKRHLPFFTKMWNFIFTRISPISKIYFWRFPGFSRFRSPKKQYKTKIWRTGKRITCRKFVVSVPDVVFGIFRWHIPSGRTMAQRSTQPLTNVNTRNISWGVREGKGEKLNAAGA
jgi:hypothetical protein